MMPGWLVKTVKRRSLIACHSFEGLISFKNTRETSGQVKLCRIRPNLSREAIVMMELYKADLTMKSPHISRWFYD